MYILIFEQLQIKVNLPHKVVAEVSKIENL